MFSEKRREKCGAENGRRKESEEMAALDAGDIDFICGRASYGRKNVGRIQ